MPINSLRLLFCSNFSIDAASDQILVFYIRKGVHHIGLVVSGTRSTSLMP